MPTSKEILLRNVTCSQVPCAGICSSLGAMIQHSQTAHLLDEWLLGPVETLIFCSCLEGYFQKSKMTKKKKVVYLVILYDGPRT